MKKVLFSLFLTFLIIDFTHAQVGVNTVTPNAMLDIKASNQAAPANTDGILIPKIDAFPIVNPTAVQKGMLVYLTTLSGGNPPGFYYWNNPGWVGIVSGSAGGTLDQAYDFGGAGLGKTITADTGAVTIAGTDGLVSTGTPSSGAVAPSGAGTRMVWNPNKSAFRVGTVSGVVSGLNWDNVNIGQGSVAMGTNTRANGSDTFAMGNNALAQGTAATAFGNATSAIGNNSFAVGNTTLASNTASTAMGTLTAASGTNSFAVGLSSAASGPSSVAMGNSTLASGGTATALGGSTVASGTLSTAMGFSTTAAGENTIATGTSNTASSFGESTFGIGATTYTPSVNGATQFRAANVTDRLLVVGNAVDTNNNGTVDLAERSDALVILKNGLTRLPSTTNAMITAADGKAVVTKEYVAANTSGTLDQAYDFGGAGAGRTITADTGAVTIAGTDGLVSTGTSGSGAIAPSGAGTRMVWNPNKAAFRAGEATGTEWDNANIGGYSAAFGFGTTASGFSSSAFGGGTIASGVSSMAFGGSTTASGAYSASFGISTTASGARSATFGFGNVASGTNSLAFGSSTTANGEMSSAFGFRNTAASVCETVLGIGATTYTPSVNGDSQFRAANATDRLFVVGNAVDANNNFTVDAAERSDALVILKNGNTGIGSSTPQDKLHVVGNIRMVDGNQATGKVFTSDANGTATWQTPAAAGTTLDGAYDFGGAGVGSTITADAGAVTIAGTDGLVSTGTAGSGALAPSGAGTRMVWNPNKAAFRAGSVSGNQWDNANIGTNSFAVGLNTRALGSNSFAFGLSAVAIGDAAIAGGDSAQAIGTNTVALGFGSIAQGLLSTALAGGTSFGPSSVAIGFAAQTNGNNATAIGPNTRADGASSVALGIQNVSSGNFATVMGRSNTAPSCTETVIGIGATTYTPSVNGATQFRAANATDRLLVVGNAIDADNNGNVDAAERSDALVILKNGLTRLPSTTNAMITAADGKAVVTKEYLAANTSGTLDQAYDFGGAGAGRTITADTGAVTIAGTDGLVSTGTLGSGAVAPSGGGTRMVWNPNKAAFRAGNVAATNWDDVNIGLRSTAFGDGSTASGPGSTAFGSGNIASGSASIVFGAGSTASGSVSAAFGSFTTASGVASAAFGFRNTAPSFGETVLGIGATTYTPSGTGASNFRAVNSTDRLLVVGNAIDINSNAAVEAVERSDALIILKNGLTRLPSTTNAMIGASDGKAVVTKEYLAATTSGTLDEAYDFGGAGAGGTITADAGAVTIAGVDGLVSTGTLGSGAVVPSGGGTRMVWNPNKAAFRAGNVAATQWDDVNIGSRSVAFGSSTRAVGNSSTAFGELTFAVGTNSTAMGFSTMALGDGSTAIGNSTSANGSASTSMGYENHARAYGETVLGIGATNSIPSFFGATSFDASTLTDRLLAVGNAIDTNNNNIIDLTERSNALVILKNGNTGIGTSAPQTKLEIVAGNKITATFGEGNLHVVSNNPQNTDIGGSISLGGFGSSIGQTSVFATVEGRKSNAGALSDSGYLAFKTNDVGVLTERMRITQDGNVGIGIASAQTALDIVGAMTVRPFVSPLLAADNQVVPVGTNGNIWLQSNSLVVGARTITLGDGIVIGQLLTLRNINNTGNFEVADDAINRNTNTIAGGRTLGIDDFITLMWVGTHWSEVNFADN